MRTVKNLGLLKRTLVLFLCASTCGFASYVNAQTSTAGTTESISGAGKGKVWWIPFNDEVVKNIRVTSNDFNPTIILRRADGTEITRNTGTQRGTPATVRLHGNPGSLGWVQVIVTGNGSGNFYFQLHEAPFVPTTPPAPLPPPQPPQLPVPPGGGTNLTATITWTEKVDYDLWVLEPGANKWISYQNHKGHGQLTPDITSGGQGSTETYRVNGGPGGNYLIKVKFFSDHRTVAEKQRNPNPTFTLTVTRNGATIVNETRTLRAGEEFGPITQ